MRPIRTGDRGAAVEDIQRRLIVLGAELGPTGVDGVFFGATLAAVQAFQSEHGLSEDGEVGPQTWAALVDATFTLGDRLLYLRFPYLHGADVRALQTALNALGFACGVADGIFGAYTERALRDFQTNTAIAVDGIAGPNTIRAIESLRHVWSSKSVPPPAELRAGPARRAAVLREHRVTVLSSDDSSEIADRIVNVATASEPSALIGTAGGAEDSTGLVLELTDAPIPGVSTVTADQTGEAFARRLAAAVSTAMDAGSGRIAVVVPRQLEGEYDLQSFAVSVLDGLCMGLGSRIGPVVP